MKRFLALAALTLLGCSDDDRSNESAQTDLAPTMEPLATPPAWPPFGPSRTIDVRCKDDRAITRTTATFLHTVTRSIAVPAPDVTSTFQASELGEGIGTFRAACYDAQGVAVTRDIRNLLVDLTPPIIEAERVVASPRVDGLEGSIGFWVRDSWVLGSVRMEFGGRSISMLLPTKYPDTLGKEWDVTYFAVPARDLPVATGDAVVVARDAAGNETRMTIPIRIDGTAPEVAIVSPASGATVSGDRLAVKISASDADTPKPTAIQLFVGGSPVGEFAGPLVDVVVDTSTLPPGPTEVRAVAHDDAGNESVSQTVVVQIP